MEFEPPRHSTFFSSPVGRVCDGTIPAGPSHTLPFPGETFQFIPDFKNRLLQDYFLNRTVMHCRITPLYCHYSNFRMSVVLCHPAGRCQLYVFMLSIIRSSKFIRSELMNTQGRGILSHLLEKISRPAACIFSGKCRTPLCRPACKSVNERTNFKLRLYALKKISPYDTKRQTY